MHPNAGWCEQGYLKTAGKFQVAFFTGKLAQCAGCMAVLPFQTVFVRSAHILSSGLRLAIS